MLNSLCLLRDFPFKVKTSEGEAEVVDTIYLFRVKRVESKVLRSVLVQIRRRDY